MRDVFKIQEMYLNIMMKQYWKLEDIHQKIRWLYKWKGEDIINPARQKEDEYVLTSRVRYLDGNKDVNSDIAWVEKNVNDTALQNHKRHWLILFVCVHFALIWQI